MVFGALLDAGELGVAMAIADFHGQPMLGVVHDHCRHLGVRHREALPAHSEVRDNLQLGHGRIGVTVRAEQRTLAEALAEAGRAGGLT